MQLNGVKLTKLYIDEAPDFYSTIINIIPILLPKKMNNLDNRPLPLPYDPYFCFNYPQLNHFWFGQEMNPTQDPMGSYLPSFDLRPNMIRFTLTPLDKLPQTPSDPQFTSSNNLHTSPSPHETTLRNTKSNLPKPPKVQKENRNVASNLLRVLLKNILTCRCYDKLIDLIISKNKLGLTCESFCKWLASFKINHKNYIKPQEMIRIRSKENCKEEQLVFRVLMQHFIKTEGVTHCLSSKRMNIECARKHLPGLRELFEVGEEKPQEKIL